MAFKRHESSTPQPTTSTKPPEPIPESKVEKIYRTCTIVLSITSCILGFSTILLWLKKRQASYSALTNPPENPYQETVEEI